MLPALRQSLHHSRLSTDGSCITAPCSRSGRGHERDGIGKLAARGNELGMNSASAASDACSGRQNAQPCQACLHDDEQQVARPAQAVLLRAPRLPLLRLGRAERDVVVYPLQTWRGRRIQGRMCSPSVFTHCMRSRGLTLTGCCSQTSQHNRRHTPHNLPGKGTQRGSPTPALLTASL